MGSLQDLIRLQGVIGCNNSRIAISTSIGLVTLWSSFVQVIRLLRREVQAAHNAAALLCLQNARDLRPHSRALPRVRVIPAQAAVVLSLSEDHAACDPTPYTLHPKWFLTVPGLRV